MSKRTRPATTAEAKRRRRGHRARCLRRWGGGLIAHYLLVKKRPVPCSLMQWAKWFELQRHHIRKTRVTMGASVSTIFLGLDHSCGYGPRQLFEDAVLYDDGRKIDVRNRYATYNEAIVGHKALCAAVATEEKQ